MIMYFVLIYKGKTHITWWLSAFLWAREVSLCLPVEFSAEDPRSCHRFTHQLARYLIYCTYHYSGLIRLHKEEESFGHTFGQHLFPFKSDEKKKTEQITGLLYWKQTITVIHSCKYFGARCLEVWNLNIYFWSVAVGVTVKNIINTTFFPTTIKNQPNFINISYFILLKTHKVFVV